MEESIKKDRIAHRLIISRSIVVLLCAFWLLFTQSTRIDHYNGWVFSVMFVAFIHVIIVMHKDINRLVREEREAREHAIEALKKADLGI